MDVLAHAEPLLLVACTRLVVRQVTSVFALALMLRNTDPADRPAVLDAAGRCLATFRRPDPDSRIQTHGSDPTTDVSDV